MADETKTELFQHPDQGISTEVAGKLIGSSGRQARRLIDRGELKGYRVGSRVWRTTPRSCFEFMAKGGSHPGGDE